MNKKIMIVIIFSMMMVAAAFGVFSGGSNPTNNIPVNIGNAVTPSAQTSNITYTNDSGTYLYSDEQILYNNQTGATWVSYNPYYNLIYITSQFGNNRIQILNGSNYNIVKQCQCVGAFSSFYDPYNHWEYMTIDSGDWIYMNNTLLTYENWAPALQLISGAYSPVNHYVYMASNKNYGMLVVNGTSNVTLIRYNSSGGGYSPFSTVYDSFNHMIYSSYYNSSANYGIVEINPLTEQIVKFIPTKNPINLVAVNDVNNELYASSYMSTSSTNSIEIFNATDSEYMGNITKISGIMGLDVHDGYLYVEGNDSTLEVFSSNNTEIFSYNNLAPNRYLMGEAYDSATGKLIITSMGIPKTETPEYSYVLSLTPFTYSSNLSLTFLSSPPMNMKITLSSSEYVCTLSGTNVTFRNLFAANYSYTVSFDAKIQHGSIDFTKSETITLTIPVSKYTFSITETGLPANVSWAYTFDSQTYKISNTSNSMSVPNGTYALQVSPVDYMYPLFSNTVSISGRNVSETIHYYLDDYHIFNSTPVIGYWINNTLSRGYFAYGGYNFSETIYNQTAIFISTTSTHASNVTLSFKVTSGLYNVIMTNDNTSKIINTTSAQNGYINVTYDPGKMPLDPIFSVSPDTCVVPPAPPPLPPGGPISVISHPAKYWDFSIWTILMWVAIAAVASLAVIYVVRRR